MTRKWLSRNDLLASRAFTQLHREEDFPEWSPTKGRKLQFTCYYDRCVPVRDTYRGDKMIYKHMPPVCRRTEEYIQQIKEEILEQGLINPILLRRTQNVWTAHPGKCRIAALQDMRIDAFPAVCVDMEGRGIPEGCYPITSPDQFAAHFEGDIVPHFTYRGVRTPKAR